MTKLEIYTAEYWTLAKKHGHIPAVFVAKLVNEPESFIYKFWDAIADQSAWIK